MRPPTLVVAESVELPAMLVRALPEGAEGACDGLHLVDGDLVLAALALTCAPCVVLLRLPEGLEGAFAHVEEHGEPLLLNISLHGTQGDGVVGQEGEAVLVLHDGSVAKLHDARGERGVDDAALDGVGQPVALTERTRGEGERLAMLPTERHLLVEVARQLAPMTVYHDVGCLLVHEVGAAHDAHEVDGIADDGLVGLENNYEIVWHLKL